MSPRKNAEGEIVGASKIARDITEQKRSQEQIATLAREAEHRSKNMLATVRAMIRLSHSHTTEGLEGGNCRAHPGALERPFLVCRNEVDWRRVGSDCHAGACSLFREPQTRVRIDGPSIALDPTVAQTIAVALHELRLMPPSTDVCLRPKAVSS